MPDFLTHPHPSSLLHLLFLTAASPSCFVCGSVVRVVPPWTYHRERGQLRAMYRLWLPCVVGLVFGMWVGGIQGWKRSVELPDVMGGQGSNGSLLVGLTLIRSAAAKGAVCLDGSLPGYHLHIGHGTGKHSWLVALEGGGMCNDTSSCVARATTKFGSSKYMARAIAFTGILSGRPEENPDFYNWNRVKVRYCDGASFSGEGYDKAHGLFFRGQRIWSAVVQELMSRGMRHADQALLSGCSAGGWAAIVHCDEFRAWFSSSTRVKCLSDAGFFVDIADISGKHTMRSLIERVVTLQGVAQNLPRTCTSLMDATSCFFPQYIINQIHTPLFILNSAYDKVQINLSVAPASADPYGFWSACKKNHAHCNADEMTVLQGLRNQVLKAVGSFSMSRQNGLFINSCFTHCQSESQTTWFAENSPALGNTRIAVAVGDWFFDRSAFKARDCAYPCDKTCHHSN